MKKTLKCGAVFEYCVSVGMWRQLWCDVMIVSWFQDGEYLLQFMRLEECRIKGLCLQAETDLRSQDLPEEGQSVSVTLCCHS